MLQSLATYISAFVTFFLLNYIWMNWAAQDLYRRSLDVAVQVQPSFQPAVVGALVFSVALTYFVIAPARRAKKFNDGLLRAAIFGAVVFAAHNLTSLSLIPAWPLGLSLIDTVWGAVAAATTTGLTLIALERFFGKPTTKRKS